MVKNIYFFLPSIHLSLNVKDIQQRKHVDFDHHLLLIALGAEYFQTV